MSNNVYLQESLLGPDEVKKDEKTENEGTELTNQGIVTITAWLFAIFVIAEIIGAVASNSLFLIGDAAAMSVDVVSYACSTWGERVKDRTGAIDAGTRMWINIYIPLASVVALLAVSVWITIEAVERVQDAANDDDDDDDEVDVTFLYVFAGLNLVIDLVSAGMLWWKRDSAFTEGTRGRVESVSRAVMAPSRDAGDSSGVGFGLARSTSMDKVGTGTEEGSWNLNMLSVLAHTGGDTLRTLAALAAAATATATGESGTLCDAWACILVTVTIVFLVIPLLSAIFNAYVKERNEASLLE